MEGKATEDFTARRVSLPMVQAVWQGWERVVQRGEIGANIQTMLKVRKSNAGRRYL